MTTLVAFVGFVWVAALIHWRLKRDDEEGMGGFIPVEGDGRPVMLMRDWKRGFWVLYVVCGLIMVRNLVRTVQVGVGKDNPLKTTKEAYI